jgi:hypothetical protein
MLRIKSVATAALSIATLLPLLASHASAQDAMAPTNGMRANYAGVGLVGGFQSKGGGSNLGGTVTGRYALPNTPLSLRGSAQFNDKNVSFQPMVTYDLPVAPGVSLYAGGGGSLLLNGKKSPLGDRNAFALTAGVEGQVAPRTVLFGDVRWGINGVDQVGTKNDAQAISIQTGAAYKF